MKKRKRKQFVKTSGTAHSSSLTPLLHLQAISTSWKWYRDCRIELDRFRDVLQEKDYSRLIIEGNPPESVLKEAWSAIYLQYCEIMQDGTYNELFDKTKRIQEFNARITLLDGIVMHLQLSYDAVLVKIVNEMGIGLDLKSDEEPVKKLKQVQGRMKRMILDMENLKKEVAALEGEKKETATMEYFEDWLSIMSKSYGYAVRDKDISVIQFVRNQKRLNEQFAKQERDGRGR